jgi:enoyl-CoA hydratase
MALTKWENFEYEREGRVLFLRFNRPERLNAVNHGMHIELMPALQEADADEDSDVVILTGAGRGFCAGGDVRGQVESPTGTNSPRGPYDVYTDGHRIVQCMLTLGKPFIAMINGPAVGLGATLALLCDVAVMSTAARIGDTHVNVGLVAGDGGTAFWPLLIGPSRAKELLMTGRLVPADEAMRIGLVNYAVAPEDLRQYTLRLAEEIAANPTFAVRATKYAVNRHMQLAALNVMDVSLNLEYLSMARPERREAAQRFLDRRRAGGKADAERDTQERESDDH